MLSAVGLFLASTLQFVDPMTVFIAFQSGMLPLGLGCMLGVLSGGLSLMELEALHSRHKHPDYGVLAAHSDYGSV